ncbi:hypothetical protein M5E87_15275 [Flavonifractor plautii]|nr:hypothetical protein M5E87_15275 [Flavonifractor plautii]
MRAPITRLIWPTTIKKMTPTTLTTVFIFSTVPGRMPNFSAMAGAVTLEPLFTMLKIKPEHQQTVQDGDPALHTEVYDRGLVAVMFPVPHG